MKTSLILATVPKTNELKTAFRGIGGFFSMDFMAKNRYFLMKKVIKGAAK